MLRTRRKSRKRRTSKTTSESETDAPRPRPSYTDVRKRPAKEILGAKPTEKRKIDKLKGIIPTKTFILKTTVEGSAAAKSALWSAVCGKVKVPKFKSNRVFARGDVEIVPADAETLNVLKELAKTREDITEPQARWPMVMIYDIDSSMSTGQLPGCIAAQNERLGITIEQGPKSIRPIFLRGPRDKPTTLWVCAVDLALFSKLLGRIYVGMSICKVVEFFDHNQCLACPKFGHSAAKVENKFVCPHCAEEDNKIEACKKLGQDPICANYKGKHRSTTKSCPKRRAAIERSI